MRWKKLCVIYSLLRCGGPPTADAQPMYPLLLAPEITTHTHGLVHRYPALSRSVVCFLSSAAVLLLLSSRLPSVFFFFKFQWPLNLHFSFFVFKSDFLFFEDLQNRQNRVFLWSNGHSWNNTSIPGFFSDCSEEKFWAQITLTPCFLVLSFFHRLTQSH